MNKLQTIVFFTALFAVLAAAGFGIYKGIIAPSNVPAVCTMEAKRCPDGSAVGRSGPDCDFPPCPKEDLIQIESPAAYEIISSPLVVKGKARGTWFFEASFSVVLTDWDGRIIAQVPAGTQNDWMTEDFVPFEAVIEFEKPAHIEGVVNRGSLILKKDNPSGLPQYDDALEMTVFFE